MSDPYTQPSLSGYNASPPADDGTAVTANALKWSKHITKIGNPLKTYSQAINSSLVTAFGKLFGHNITTKSGDYVVVSGDQGKFIEVTATATITLLAAATAGANFPLAIVNTGSGVVTVDGDSSETINGATTITLNPGEAIILTCNATKWIGVVTLVLGSTFSTHSSGYTVLASDRGTFLEATAVLTFTLLPAATAGSGFPLVFINNGPGTVTIDGNSSETINGSTTISLLPNDGIILTCDGSQWLAMQATNSQRKRTTADFDKTSSPTLEDVPGLTGFTIKAATVYAVRGFLPYTFSGAGQGKLSMDLSQTPAESQIVYHAVDSTGAAVQDSANAGATAVLATSATAGGIVVSGFIEGHATLDATLDLQFAQNASNAATSTIHKNAWLKFEAI